MMTGFLPFYFDPTYILVLIGLVITMIASSSMKSTYARYSKTAASCGLTGAQVAKKILAANNIYDVSVQPVQGSLTDNFNPKNKTVNLSQAVFASSSLAAIGVAAHECGHAIQEAEGYGPLRFRSAFVPVANFGSRLAWPLIIIGILLGAGREYASGTGIGATLISAGIILYALAVAFQLITLPVEFNASSRAIRQLETLGILSQTENDGARKVLKAAAWTYVAAASSGILSLLRIILLFGGRGNRKS